MIPVFSGDDSPNAPVGHWYSHPQSGSCRAGEALGIVRADGSRCLWRQRSDARVMRGWQLYAAGLNTTGLRCNFRNPATLGPGCSPLAAQIRQNVKVMRGVHAAAPLQPWSCGGGGGGGGGGGASCPPPVTLAGICGNARRASVGNCLICMAQKFLTCSTMQVDQFCAGGGAD